MLHSSLLPFSEPMVNSENDAESEVLYSASAAAIFIGCCESISRACTSPVTAVAIPAASVTRQAEPHGPAEDVELRTCGPRARRWPRSAPRRPP